MVTKGNSDGRNSLVVCHLPSMKKCTSDIELFYYGSFHTNNLVHNSKCQLEDSHTAACLCRCCNNFQTNHQSFKFVQFRWW